MHGSVLHGFKQFVLGRDGRQAWDNVCVDAGASGWYFSTETYPDEELAALVRTTAAHEERSVQEVLQDFGTSLAALLLDMYAAFVQPAWRTLDLLLATETLMHRTVRMQDPSATPPHLYAKRVSEREVHIEYTSQRRLCSLAVGICRGVANHYGESVMIEQPECMERGSPACRLVVRLM